MRMCLNISHKILGLLRKSSNSKEIGYPEGLLSPFTLGFLFPLFLADVKKKIYIILNSQKERKRFKIFLWIRFAAHLQSG